MSLAACLGGLGYMSVLLSLPLHSRLNIYYKTDFY